MVTNYMNLFRRAANIPVHPSIAIRPGTPMAPLERFAGSVKKCYKIHYLPMMK